MRITYPATIVPSSTDRYIQSLNVNVCSKQIETNRFDMCTKCNNQKKKYIHHHRITAHTHTFAYQFVDLSAILRCQMSDRDSDAM